MSNKFTRFLKYANQSADDAVRGYDDVLNAVDRKLSRPAKAVGKAYGKSLVKRDPSGQNFGNAFTGFQEGGGLIGTAAVLGGGYAAFGSMKAVAMPEKTGEVSYAGPAPIHNADGVSNAPTLGASGNMVFGMHQGRRG